MKKYSLRKRQWRWGRIWAGAGIFLIIVLIGTAIAIRQNYYHNLKPVSASQRALSVTIPVGSTAQDIGKKLQQQGLIRASWAFEWYVRNHDVRDRLQAGTYSLRPNQSVGEIVNILTHGKVATDLITILPGQRLDQVREALINNGGFSPEAVDKALDPAQYADHPALADKPTEANLEGYLYPDSFQKTADTKPETIIRASLDEMQKHLTPEVRDAITKQGLTVHQGIILASIIEQEVSKAQDKPTVAQVFLLRLKQNMPLGSDVTAFYGALKAGQTPSVAIDTPYNTRLHPGLPPGPISNVSDASLQAVAKPADTDYLYFVAGDDGVTYFSHTEAEHEALTQEHCKKLCNE
ncbi:MAG TPA: endolytic transglycosylase MltG [Patescibacteria group bacterium]|nr:endolytic transglycosylase MltG [Patescibacteria group bacterium]